MESFSKMLDCRYYFTRCNYYSCDTVLLTFIVKKMVEPMPKHNTKLDNHAVVLTSPLLSSPLFYFSLLSVLQLTLAPESCCWPCPFLYCSRVWGRNISSNAHLNGEEQNYT